MIRQNESRGARAGNLVTKYLKFKALSKAAKGLGKTTKSTARDRAAKPTQRMPKKAWVALAVGAGAAALAARKLRHGRADRSQPTPA